MDDKLEEIRLENYIIIIYYVLLTIYLYANSIEVNYIKYNNEIDKERYKLLLYIVFGITAIIALYYTIDSFKDLRNNDRDDIRRLKELSLLANILVLIAAVIILYIIYRDVDLNLEVSP